MEEAKSKRKYCPKGERWNNKTKKCEPKKEKSKPPVETVAEELVSDLLSLNPVDLSKPVSEGSKKEESKKEEKRPYCPKGERWDSKTKKCIKKEEMAKKKIVDQQKKTKKRLVIRADDMPIHIENKRSDAEENPVIGLMIPKKEKAPIKKRKLIIKPNDTDEKEVEDEKVVEDEQTLQKEDDLPELVQIGEEIIPEELASELENEPEQISVSEEYIPEQNELDQIDKAYEEKRNTNEFLLEKERIEYLHANEEQEYDFLYPHLNDQNFNVKIAKKKEFNDTKYDGKIRNIEKHANLLCNTEFELMSHQLFVKNCIVLSFRNIKCVV
jgi:hypothetical protein